MGKSTTIDAFRCHHDCGIRGQYINGKCAYNFLPNDVETMPNALLKPGINSSARHCSGRSRELHCGQRLQWSDSADEAQRRREHAAVIGCVSDIDCTCAAECLVAGRCVMTSTARVACRLCSRMQRSINDGYPAVNRTLDLPQTNKFSRSI